MALLDVDNLSMSLSGESSCGSLNAGAGSEANPTLVSPVLEVSTSSLLSNPNIPTPPPLPTRLRNGIARFKLLSSCSFVPIETKAVWDKLFMKGYGADVCIVLDDEQYIRAHSYVLSIASPVFGNILEQSKAKNRDKQIKISHQPYKVVYAFIRFLYSSCYDEEDMKKFVLHLLILSHSYSVPSLKRVCIHHLERGWLTKENLIDVLQLARGCDAPRLSFICLRMVIGDFKIISSTEGWKVMKRANPALEQELLQSVVEADSREQQRLKKKEERKIYVELHEAMEALVHICRDGCRTIGPRKILQASHVACGFPACKGIENLIRHFSACKTRVPGGCNHCKRMWQLLELHSGICNDLHTCKVPLCRHFKGKMQQQCRKDEARWKMLVCKVKEAKNSAWSVVNRRS